MSAQRDHSQDDARRRRVEALEKLARLRQELADENPDMTSEDWDAVAEEWAEEVNEGLRDIVRRGRGELPAMPA